LLASERFVAQLFSARVLQRDPLACASFATVHGLAVSLILSFLVFGCGSKKEAPPATDPPKGSAATEPPKGSATGSAAGSDTGSSAAGSGSDAGSNMAAGSGSAGSAAGSGSGDDKHWFDTLSHDEKMDFMKKTVVPKMKPLFQKFDAKEFANFGCKTCHGKDPQKAKFKMPSPDVPALDFAALKAGKQKPEMAKWMGEVVKPEMAKLLKEEEYTDANPKGFGCLACHEMKK
jgi:hypothetical protein